QKIMSEDPSFCTDNPPKQYQEIYRILSGSSSSNSDSRGSTEDSSASSELESPIDRGLFLALLERSGLPAGTLRSIWSLAEPADNYLTKRGLFRALALIGLSQAGGGSERQQAPSLAALRALPEAPTPNFGDLASLAKEAARLRRERQPAKMSMSLEELEELDTVTVTLQQEQKGVLVFRHRVYKVTSRRYDSSNLRRYNDFRSLNELLLQRYPYRIVPQLPGKGRPLSGSGGAAFLEERERGLQCYLNLLARHPTVCDDEMLRLFFTCSGEDFEKALRSAFGRPLDEFLTHAQAASVKQLVPPDAVQRHEESRRFAQGLLQRLTACRDCLRCLAEASRSAGAAVAGLAVRLDELGRQPQLQPPVEWAAMSAEADSWAQVQAGLPRVTAAYQAVAARYEDKAALEDSVVASAEYLVMLIDGFVQLAERVKHLKRDHDRSMRNLTDFKKRASSHHMAGRDRWAVEDLENRIAKHESVLQDLEARTHFANFCLGLETQLVQANLPLVRSLLLSLTGSQIVGHAQIAEHWSNCKPLVEGLLQQQQQQQQRSPGIPGPSENRSPKSAKLSP
ncbi:hypothetical protein BOX15_Mlig003417g2, partial [Macrostomum lignano]